VNLPPPLYWQCRTLFLKCAQFEGYRRLSDFCEPQEELSFLVEDLTVAESRGALVESCLKLLLKADENGYLFLVFVKALQDSCHPGKALWSELNELYTKIQALQEQYQPCQPSAYSSEQRLFKTILRIDFDEQEKLVEAALKKQSSHKRIAALLVHGEEKFGQGTLVTRLLSQSQLPQLLELRNGRQIKIKVGGMGDISNLWNEVAKHFINSNQVTLVSSQQIMDEIFECLRTQHLIFIFTEVHRTYIGFLSELIQEFWQPLVERANHKETYLVMFLIDNKGSVCKSDIPLAWDVNQSEYPTFPLHLPPASRFPLDKLAEWLGMAVAAELVPDNLSAETLLRESKGGVPELVYQKICYYCGCSWEGGLAKWLIQ
jgi:hypothetical protein